MNNDPVGYKLHMGEVPGSIHQRHRQHIEQSMPYYNLIMNIDLADIKDLKDRKMYEDLTKNGKLERIKTAAKDWLTRMYRLTNNPNLQLYYDANDVPDLNAYLGGPYRGYHPTTTYPGNVYRYVEDIDESPYLSSLPTDRVHCREEEPSGCTLSGGRRKKRKTRKRKRR